MFYFRKTKQPAKGYQTATTITHMKYAKAATNFSVHTRKDAEYENTMKNQFLNSRIKKKKNSPKPTPTSRVVTSSMSSIFALYLLRPFQQPTGHFFVCTGYSKACLLLHLGHNALPTVDCAHSHAHQSTLFITS